ncbi:uncharacterized protein [Epargyreus clarus]|uniref:uncharacterized protein n=1 Tax=Epargyreus clarus TaxID=520877 RepID=UPI003C2E7B5C
MMIPVYALVALVNILAKIQNYNVPKNLPYEIRMRRDLAKHSDVKVEDIVKDLFIRDGNSIRKYENEGLLKNFIGKIKENAGDGVGARNELKDDFLTSDSSSDVPNEISIDGLKFFKDFLNKYSENNDNIRNFEGNPEVKKDFEEENVEKYKENNLNVFEIPKSVEMGSNKKYDMKKIEDLLKLLLEDSSNSENKESNEEITKLIGDIKSSVISNKNKKTLQYIKDNNLPEEIDIYEGLKLFENLKNNQKNYVTSEHFPERIKNSIFDVKNKEPTFVNIYKRMKRATSYNYNQNNYETKSSYGINNNDNGYSANGYSNGYGSNGYNNNGYSNNGYDNNGYSSNGYSNNGDNSNGYNDPTQNYHVTEKTTISKALNWFRNVVSPHEKYVIRDYPETYTSTIVPYIANGYNTPHTDYNSKISSIPYTSNGNIANGYNSQSIKPIDSLNNGYGAPQYAPYHGYNQQPVNTNFRPLYNSTNGLNRYGVNNTNNGYSNNGYAVDNTNNGYDKTGYGINNGYENSGYNNINDKNGTTTEAVILGTCFMCNSFGCPKYTKRVGFMCVPMKH